MVDTASRRIASPVRATRHALLTLVREACDMLNVSHPSIVGDITLSRNLDDPSAARLVATTARRLAEEYGVNADAWTDGNVLVVHLARDPRHIHRPRNNDRHASLHDRARPDKSARQ
jgi:hypothetical protein